MIVEYTRKFFNSLLKIEHSEKMEPFFGEDKRQRSRLDYMRDKFLKISEIIEEIDNLQPNLRTKAVKSVEEQMRKLEQELVAKDKEMKKVNGQLLRAMVQTVDIEPLSSRIFGKYLKHLEENVKQLKDKHLVPKSYARHRLHQTADTLIAGGENKIIAREESKHPEILPNSGGNNDLSNSMKERAALGTTETTDSSANAREIHQDLTGGTVIESYKSQGKEAVFFLRPDSSEIYFMDQKKGNFVKERVQGSRIPFRFST